MCDHLMNASNLYVNDSGLNNLHIQEHSIHVYIYVGLSDIMMCHLCYLSGPQ
jgi:hypothetical protein